MKDTPLTPEQCALVEANLGLIPGEARYWFPRYAGYFRGDAGQAFEELQDLCRMALLDTARDYDAAKANFRGFYRLCVRAAICDELKARGRLRRQPGGGIVSVDTLEPWREPSDPVEGPEALAVARDLVERAMAQLTEPQAVVMRNLIAGIPAGAGALRPGWGRADNYAQKAKRKLRAWWAREVEPMV